MGVLADNGGGVGCGVGVGDGSGVQEIAATIASTVVITKTIFTGMFLSEIEIRNSRGDCAVSVYKHRYLDPHPNSNRNYAVSVGST